MSDPTGGAPLVPEPQPEPKRAGARVAANVPGRRGGRPARVGRGAGAPRDRFRINRAILPTLAALAIFIAMLVFGQLRYGHIFQYSTLSNLVINNAQMIILAVGLTFVIITGGIDLSVGAVVALSSVSGVLLSQQGWPAAVAVPIMIGIGLACGLLSGTLVRFFGVQPFIATLAVMFLARGLASMLSTKPVRLPDGSGILALGEPIKLVDGPKVNDLTVSAGVIIAAVVVVVAYFLLQRTRFGRTIYAIGGSEQSAELMGLPVQRTKLLIYALSGTLSGIAAVVFTARLGIAQNITGLGWELDAIASTVIGGTLLTGGAGYVLGSVVGSLVLGLMVVLITRDGGVPPEATTIITGGILLMFVVLQRAVVRQRK
ncbi:MAG: sugar ABC transporter permease [Bifidobacteriaceae bacterium]|jgi:simple sugar transport system permease protein|nr:sugar ABC transporter permease [Bifidobacteriaceae bacterium]